jgi:hypothetical protein
MAFTVDYTTNLGKVRAIIRDVDSTKAIFSDEELQPFLDICNDTVLLAAAMALDTMATRQALVLKVQQTLELKLDGAKVAEALREHADRLRKQYEDLMLEDEAGFDIAQVLDTDFAVNEYLLKKLVAEEA